MRFHFDPTPEQRAALEVQLVRLQQPVATLELLDPILPAGFAPAAAACTLQSVHSDRFVVQARVRSSGGDERVYALKTYSADSGERVWTHARQLAERLPPRPHRPCLPIQYIPQERVMIFDWVEGRSLSKIVDGGKLELLRHAAVVAADVHRVPIVPERPTTPQMLVDETRARCDNLRPVWPATADLVKPLLAQLQAAVPHLDSADLAPIHGDMAAGQVLLTRDRLLPLAWDMFGFADPADDGRPFRGRLERPLTPPSTLPPHARPLPGCFQDAQLA